MHLQRAVGILPKAHPPKKKFFTSFRVKQPPEIQTVSTPRKGGSYVRIEYTDL